MFITLHHAILYLGEFTGHENFKKRGEIRVRDSLQGKEVNTGFTTEVQCLGSSTVLKTVSFQ